jgi:hypothetical protein
MFCFPFAMLLVHYSRIFLVPLYLPVFAKRHVDLDEGWAAWDTTADMIRNKSLMEWRRSRQKKGSEADKRIRGDEALGKGVDNSGDERVLFRGKTFDRSCWRGDQGGWLMKLFKDDKVRGGEEWGQDKEQGSTDQPEQVLCGRRLLRVLSSQRPDLIDAGYDWQGLTEYMRRRNHLYVEGNSGWADRARLLMLLRQDAEEGGDVTVAKRGGWRNGVREVGEADGPVLLMQETMCREWYTLLLEPWSHYLPVDYFFETLLPTTDWLRGTARRDAVQGDAVQGGVPPQDAGEVGSRGAADTVAARKGSDATRKDMYIASVRRNIRQYADAVLTREAAAEYARALLINHAALLKYKIRRRTGAGVLYRAQCTSGACSLKAVSDVGVP